MLFSILHWFPLSGFTKDLSAIVHFDMDIHGDLELGVDCWIRLTIAMINLPTTWDVHCKYMITSIDVARKVVYKDYIVTMARFQSKGNQTLNNWNKWDQKDAQTLPWR
jgi:hypothetical protein